MKTDTLSARDRAALKRTATYADGEYNSELEIEATAEGIELDLGVVIPWEWILFAAGVLRGDQRNQTAGVCSRGRCNSFPVDHHFRIAALKMKRSPLKFSPCLPVMGVERDAS